MASSLDEVKSEVNLDIEEVSEGDIDLKRDEPAEVKVKVKVTSMGPFKEHHNFLCSERYDLHLGYKEYLKTFSQQRQEQEAGEEVEFRKNAAEMWAKLPDDLKMTFLKKVKSPNFWLKRQPYILHFKSLRHGRQS